MGWYGSPYRPDLGVVATIREDHPDVASIESASTSVTDLGRSYYYVTRLASTGIAVEVWAVEVEGGILWVKPIDPEAWTGGRIAIRQAEEGR
jgi:hypothetical protein